MDNNTTQKNHNIGDLEIFKMEANKIYEDCELTGIKINSNESYIREKFGKEIADIFIEFPEALGEAQSGIKNNKDIAEEYLHNIVKIDAIQYEINQQMGGSIDTNKKLDFELFMTDKNGKEHTVKFENFQLGINDTTKGFQHLLMQAKSIDEKKSVIKSNSKLDDICKVPSQLLKDKIASRSHDIVKSLSNTIPQDISPEMSAFLKQFVDKFLDSDKQQTRKAFISEIERQDKKKKEEKNKKPDVKNNTEKKVQSSVKNPQEQIITTDMDNIEAKRYEHGKEPQRIKDFKSDIKKIQDYEKKYNEIMSAENSLSANDKKEQLNKLENDSGISAAEFIGIKQEQDELRKIAMSEAAKAQSQKKSLNNEQVATKDNEKINPAPMNEPKYEDTQKYYDNFYLNIAKDKSERSAGKNSDLKVKFYANGNEPEYIKEFKSNPQKIKDYEKEFQSIYAISGLPINKQTDLLGKKIDISPDEIKNKINNLERTYKVTIPEFLGVKHEQVQKRIEAVKDIQKNNLSKTAKSKEQIRTNQPTDRSL